MTTNTPIGRNPGIYSPSSILQQQAPIGLPSFLLSNIQSFGSSEDKDKAFEPCTEGLVLGIMYDTVAWEWWIREDKLNRIFCDIRAVLESTQVKLKDIWSVVGKILHVKELVVPGKYYVGELLRLFNTSEDGTKLVTPGEHFKMELEWWYTILHITAKRTRIPSPYDAIPLDARGADSDASGGSTSSWGRGVGVVLDGHRWVYMPWPSKINSSAIAPCCNMRWAHKMSFLELVGHVLRIICFPDNVQNQNVYTNIDNSGTVRYGKKGYCVSCSCSDTLLRTAYQVTTALNGRQWIKEITRCSTPESISADAISKCDWATLEKTMPKRDEDPAKIPRSFLKWMTNPKLDRELGIRIIQDLKKDGYKMIEDYLAVCK